MPSVKIDPRSVPITRSAWSARLTEQSPMLNALSPRVPSRTTRTAARCPHSPPSSKLPRLIRSPRRRARIRVFVDGRRIPHCFRMKRPDGPNSVPNWAQLGYDQLGDAFMMRELALFLLNWFYPPDLSNIKLSSDGRVSKRWLCDR